MILGGVTRRIAISVPDELFRQMERVRRQRRVPRSRVVQDAVGEYVQRRSDGRPSTAGGDDPAFVAIERAAIEDLKRALRRARHTTPPA